MAFVLVGRASVRVLALEFIGATLYTAVIWKLRLPIRGISRAKDGPLNATGSCIIAVAVLVLFLVCAFA